MSLSRSAMQLAWPRAMRVRPLCTSLARRRPAALEADLEHECSWAPERLGLYNRTPLLKHSNNVAHLPGQATQQKHTFDQDYFRSASCRSLLKVSYEGRVAVESIGGIHQAVAKRDLRAGEIVERGILRGFDPDALQERSKNPAVLRLGQDFLTGPVFPWSEYSSRAGPPFLPSGCLAQYAASHEHFNVELKVRESHVQGLEFEAVATEDMSTGTPLVRRTVLPVSTEKPKYADIFDMSDEDVQRYVSFFKNMDMENAEKAGVAPDVVHEETILQHARATRSSAAGIVDCSLVVTLPHPSWPGFGVFALKDIPAGSVIESGVTNQVFSLNGDKCPYVFTWNQGGKRFTDGTENTWCHGSGNAMFYNSDNPSNCRMYRFYDHFRFLIVAKRDIKEGEEVMHLYASSSWRKCFVEDSYLPKLLPVEQA